MWRVGEKIPINVYDEDQPVCQTHTAAYASRIVEAINTSWRMTRAEEAFLRAILDDIRDGHTVVAVTMKTGDGQACVRESGKISATVAVRKLGEELYLRK
jgi:hypothetical protein